MNTLTEKETVTLKPEHNIVASTVQTFRDQLKSMINSGTVNITIDLIHVEMIDSVGLGVFIATHNSLSKAGGRLVVNNASEDIFRLLKMMRLDKHFTVTEVEKEL